MAAINNSQFPLEATGYPSTGFQAVILCGPGTSLYPFTGAEDMLPKALLPIANKPMIHYSLEWCEKASFCSILILTLTEHLTAIQSYIHSRTFPFAIQVEAPSALDDNLGTADVLRKAYRHGWMVGDIVVLPCDLVTDLNPEEVLKIWMVENAGFGNDNAREDNGRRGGLGVWYGTKGEGNFRGQETDFLALAPHPEPSIGSNPGSQHPGTLKTLLYTLPSLAIKEQEGVPLRKSLLSKFRNFQLSSSRRDSGIYFLPFWVLKFIDKNPKISSIREDVLPWWSKARWQDKRLAERLGLLDILSSSGISDKRDNIGEMSTTRKRDVEKWIHKDDKLICPVYSDLDLEVMAKQKLGIVVFREQERAPEVPKSDTSSITTTPPGDIKIPPMIAYLPDTTFICRVDTIQLYLLVSLYLANPTFPSTQAKTHQSASIDKKAHVNRSDCLIASKVTIAERAVVKRCVLGHGVSVAKGTKLLGCVLMDGVSVAEGASLEGCTVGMNALVGAGVKLKDCQVSQGFFVEPEMQAKNEVFIAFARLDDDNASATPKPGLEGAYDSKRRMSQEQHVLDKPYSATKPANVKHEERRSELRGMRVDILTAQGYQKATEVELKTSKDMGGNEDHEKQNKCQKTNDKDQTVTKGQINNETQRGEDETTKTSHKLDKISGPVGQDNKNQEDHGNQKDSGSQENKDQKKHEYQMGDKNETTKPDMADDFKEGQEMYLPARSSSDNQQKSGETEFLLQHRKPLKLP